MDNAAIVISVILSYFICGVNLQSLGCPFNQKAPRQIEAFGITLEDILNGDIIVNKDPDQLKTDCAEATKKKVFDEIEKLLNDEVENCNYGGTKPQLAAYNPKGFKAALEYMCTNIKVFTDNYQCFNNSQGAMKQCRDKQTDLAKKENKSPLEQICSQQRIHSFCAGSTLRSECNDAIADFKKTIADHILSPQCGCQRKVKKMQKGEMLSECYNMNCVKGDMGYIKEEEVSDGIVFGLKTAASIESICKKVDVSRLKARSAADGKQYDLANKIKSCLSRDCGYRYKDYKLKLINEKGMIAAANYICEKRNYMMGTEESRKIVDELLGKAIDCQKKKVQDEVERLEDMNKGEDMNEIVCSKHRIIKQCIKDTFNCATCETIRSHLLTAWDMRLPALCQKCEDIGYAPVLSSSASKYTTTVLLQSLFVIFSALYVTLFNY